MKPVIIQIMVSPWINQMHDSQVNSSRFVTSACYYDSWSIGYIGTEGSEVMSSKYNNYLSSKITFKEEKMIPNFSAAFAAFFKV